MIRFILSITLGVALIFSVQPFLPVVLFADDSLTNSALTDRLNQTERGEKNGKNGKNENAESTEKTESPHFFSSLISSQSNQQHKTSTARQTMNAAEVISVIDGDTVRLKTNEKTLQAHLAYIDAPEKEQPFGKQAKQQLSQLVLQKNVLIQSVGDKWLIYHRGENINLNMLQLGYAWPSQSLLNRSEHQGEKPAQRMLRDYLQAYEIASESQRGLWGLAHELRVSPWQWRKQTVEISPGKEYKFNLTNPFLQKNQNQYRKMHAEKRQASEKLEHELGHEIERHRAMQEQQAQQSERTQPKTKIKSSNQAQRGE